MLVDSNISKDSRELFEKIILGVVAVQKPFSRKIGQTPSTIIMVGADPSVVTEMPGVGFINSVNPGWKKSLMRIVQNSSSEHTTILMPKTAVSRNFDSRLIANRVWLAYDPERDLQRDAFVKVYQMSYLTADLGGINLRDLLQRSGANASSYQLRENENFYVAHELLQNKAMAQLQNEIYAQRKAAVSA